MPTRAGPITYHAKELGDKLGLPNLWVSFNGYWPEKHAFVEACAFKAYEAYPTLQRMRERRQGALQISSAGNTARAFAIASSETGEKVVLVVPTTALENVWTTKDTHDNILLFAVDGDYYDAITYGRALVSTFDDLLPEGGAKNVARRDGMGLTMLDAAVTIGNLPDYYFQGVGSGTGGIAAFEMAAKLLDDGSYGEDMTKFYLSQNLPFIPMVNAWNAGRREIMDEDMLNAEETVNQVYAPVLTNRHPPYSITGGVFDILLESDGKMLAVTNEAAIRASELFESVEGIDIDPAAAVALASLIAAQEADDFDKEGTILLNITGGGYKRVMSDHDVNYVTPAKVLSQDDYTLIDEEVSQLVTEFLQ
jgi:cysteate synthase